MDELQATLSAAGRRQAQLDKLIAEAEAELQQRKRNRQAVHGGQGRGRMNAREQAIENKLNATLVRLRAGVLPGEQMSAARAPTEQVAHSAQQNAQHHASALNAPSGRTAPAPASGAENSSSSSGARGSNGSGSSSGSGGGSGGAGGDDADDEHDDLPDAAFHQYYRVSPQQKAFNQAAAKLFTDREGKLPSATIQPGELLKGCCKPELIGVGACHVHAPHKYLGLPLPPCP